VERGANFPSEKLHQKLNGFFFLLLMAGGGVRRIVRGRRRRRRRRRSRNEVTSVPKTTIETLNC